MKVKEIMNHPVITCREESSLEEAARLMLDNKIGCLPVLDQDGKIIGIITESDFAAKSEAIPFTTIRAPQILGQWISREGIEQIYREARNRRAEEVMTRRVFTVEEDDPLETAVELMLREDVNRVPVVKEGKPVGVVSRRDLLRLVLDKC